MEGIFDKISEAILKMLRHREKSLDCEFSIKCPRGRVPRYIVGLLKVLICIEAHFFELVRDHRKGHRIVHRTLAMRLQNLTFCF